MPKNLILKLVNISIHCSQEQDEYSWMKSSSYKHQGLSIRALLLAEGFVDLVIYSRFAMSHVIGKIAAEAATNINVA